MSLTILDFVQQVDGVTVEDIPDSTQSSLNAVLEDQTGGDDGDLSNPESAQFRRVSKNLNGRAGFDSINDAIKGDNRKNGAASGKIDEGATIFVEDGEFNESITIDVERLTLEGPNAGIDGDSGSRDAEATITGKVNIGDQASNTLSGEIVIDGVEVATTAPDVLSDGVISVADREQKAENVTIKNSVVDIGLNGGAGVGIASEEVDNLSIENNAFTQSGTGTSVAYNAVQSPINTIEISENTLTDVDRLYNEAAGGAFIDGRGIDSTTVRIVDNDVNGANFAIGTGIVDDDLTTVDYVIRGNQIEASSVGVSRGSGTTASFTIENNDFTGDSGTTYVDDAANELLDLSAILNNQGNTFTPNAEIIDEDGDGTDDQIVTK
jgi:hypothetical protein